MGGLGCNRSHRITIDMENAGEERAMVHPDRGEDHQRLRPVRTETFIMRLSTNHKAE
jgi:hypothetical protein